MKPTFGMLVTLFCLSQLISGANWTKQGDLVYWQENGAAISVAPHTATGIISHVQYANFSYNRTGNPTVNISFVFPADVTGGKIEIYGNYAQPNYSAPNYVRRNLSGLEYGVQNYSAVSASGCVGGDANNTQAYNVTQKLGNYTYSSVYCFNTAENLGNDTWRLNYSVNEFAGYKNMTAPGWHDITGQFTYSQISGKKVMTINNVPFPQYTLYQARITYDTKFNSSGKFDIYVHAGSPADVVAGTAPIYIQLDPWYATGANMRLIINKVAGYVGSLNNYTFIIQVNSTYNLTGWGNLTVTYTDPSTGTETEIGYYLWNETKLAGWSNPSKAQFINWSYTYMNGTLLVYIPSAIPNNQQFNITLYNSTNGTASKSNMQSAAAYGDDMNAVGMNTTKYINASSVAWDESGAGLVVVAGGGYPNTMFVAGMNFTNFEVFWGAYGENSGTPYTAIVGRAQTTVRTGSAWKGYNTGFIEQSGRADAFIGGEGIAETYASAGAGCDYSVNPREVYSLYNGTNLYVKLIDDAGNSCNVNQTGTASLGGGFLGLQHAFGGTSGFDWAFARNFLNGTENTTGLKMEVFTTTTTAPNITNVTVQPQLPKVSSNLSCNALLITSTNTTAAVDWYLNGVNMTAFAVKGIQVVNGSTVSYSNVTFNNSNENSNWSCTVYGNSSTEISNASSANVTVLWVYHPDMVQVIFNGSAAISSATYSNFSVANFTQPFDNSTVSKAYVYATLTARTLSGNPPSINYRIYVDNTLLLEAKRTMGTGAIGSVSLQTPLINLTGGQHVVYVQHALDSASGSIDSENMSLVIFTERDIDNNRSINASSTTIANTTSSASFADIGTFSFNVSYNSSYLLTSSFIANNTGGSAATMQYQTRITLPNGTQVNCSTVTRTLDPGASGSIGSACAIFPDSINGTVVTRLFANITAGGTLVLNGTQVLTAYVGESDMNLNKTELSGKTFTTGAMQQVANTTITIIANGGAAHDLLTNTAFSAAGSVSGTAGYAVYLYNSSGLVAQSTVNYRAFTTSQGVVIKLAQFTNVSHGTYTAALYANVTAGTVTISDGRIIAIVGDDTRSSGVQQPPSSVGITSPANTTYLNSTSIDVVYTASASPQGYNITTYAINLSTPAGANIRSLVGNNYPNLTYSIPAFTLAPGSYMVSVQVFDSQNLTSLAYSAVFTVLGNSAPSISSIALQPAQATTANALSCYVQAVDDTASTIQINYRFSLNNTDQPSLAGSTNITNGTNSLVASVSLSNPLAGSWRCNATAYDGVFTSPVATSNTVQALYAIQACMIVNSTNGTAFPDTDMLVGQVQALSYSAGQLVNYTWFRNGAAFQSGQSSALNMTLENITSVNSSNLVAGDMWILECADSLDVPGTAINSSQISVASPLPIQLVSPGNGTSPAGPNITFVWNYSYVTNFSLCVNSTSYAFMKCYYGIQAFNYTLPFANYAIVNWYVLGVNNATVFVSSAGWHFVVNNSQVQPNNPKTIQQIGDLDSIIGNFFAASLVIILPLFAIGVSYLVTTKLSDAAFTAAIAVVSAGFLVYKYMGEAPGTTLVLIGIALLAAGAMLKSSNR